VYWQLLSDRAYRRRVVRWAKAMGSDGCSGVSDCYVIACYDHDIAYRSGHDLFGQPLTRAQADARLRWGIQNESPLGRLSPMSWWRWAGVRLFGWRSWQGAGARRKAA
jgi:hypothetical protein